MSPGESLDVEIRVHGMGDHRLESALDPPTVTVRRHPRGPDTADPPGRPDHTVKLVNWSRTSRVFGLLWYAAVPFAILNMAAIAMPPKRTPVAVSTDEPAGKSTRTSPGTAQWGLTTLIGMLLTALALVWLIAIGETLLREVEWGRNRHAGGINVSVCAALLLIGMAVQAAKARGWLGTHPRRETGRYVVCVLLNAGTVIATAVAVAMTPQYGIAVPGVPLPVLTVPVPSGGDPTAVRAAFHEHLVTERGGIENVAAPDELRVSDAVCWALDTGRTDLVGHQLDVLNALVALSFALAFIVAAVFIAMAVVGAVIDRRRPHARRGTRGSLWTSTRIAPLTAAATLVVVSVAWLNATASALRLGLAWVSDFLSDYPSLPLLGVGMDSSRRKVMAYQGPQGRVCGDGVAWYGSFFVDTLPVMTLLALLCIGASAWMWNQREFVNLRSTRGYRGKALWARFAHVVVVRLPGRMTAITSTAAVTWICLAVVLWYWARPDEFNPSLQHDVLVIASILIALLSFAFWAIGGRIGPVRKSFGIIIDLAGFWDPKGHPLAGDSYRGRVTSGIESEILRHPGKRVVLVGHSQGSVLCTWLAAKIQADDESARRSPLRDVHLVTCGSPVRSLYQVFFPRVFDDALIASARGSVETWDNVWRVTDPIATPIHGARRSDASPETNVRNTCLPDPPLGNPQRGVAAHSYYWTDPGQAALIAALFAAPRTADRDPASASSPDP